MDRIVIRPHHDRWGIYEDPDAPPLSEYDTRELAELAAPGADAIREEQGGL